MPFTPRYIVLWLFLASLIVGVAAFILQRDKNYEAQLSACNALPNHSVQREVETDRLFIDLPKSIYPTDVRGYFTTVSGDAKASYVSNGGPPGEGLRSSATCSSTYFEFDGVGEVDLNVPSLSGAPGYSVRFLVEPTK